MDSKSSLFSLLLTLIVYDITINCLPHQHQPSSPIYSHYNGTRSVLVPRAQERQQFDDNSQKYTVIEYAPVHSQVGHPPNSYPPTIKVNGSLQYAPPPSIPYNFKGNPPKWNPFPPKKFRPFPPFVKYFTPNPINGPRLEFQSPPPVQRGSQIDRPLPPQPHREQQWTSLPGRPLNGSGSGTSIIPMMDFPFSGKMVNTMTSYLKQLLPTWSSGETETSSTNNLKNPIHIHMSGDSSQLSIHL